MNTTTKQVSNLTINGLMSDTKIKQTYTSPQLKHQTQYSNLILQQDSNGGGFDGGFPTVSGF